jgi:hypothetical protein
MLDLQYFIGAPPAAALDYNDARRHRQWIACCSVSNSRGYAS